MKKITVITALLVGLSVSSYGGRADIYIEECNGGIAEMCQMAAQFLENERKSDEAKKYYIKAMDIMKEECSAGDVNACDNMGDFYAKGLGVKKSKAEAKKAYEKAVELSKRSCDKGDTDSCSMVDFIDMKLKKL